MAFSIPTLGQSGSLDSGTVTPATSGPGDTLGFYNQSVLGDADHSQHDWTLPGRLRGMRDTSASGDELVRLGISGKQTEINPTPTAAAMGLLGLAAVPARRRR